MTAGRQVQPVLEEAGVCCHAGGFGNFSPPPSVRFSHPNTQKTHLKAPPTLHANVLPSWPSKQWWGAVMGSTSHPLCWWRCSSKACAGTTPVPDAQLTFYFFIQNFLWNVLLLTRKDNPPSRPWILRWLLLNRSQVCCSTTKWVLILTYGRKNPHLMWALWHPYLRFIISLTTPFSAWKLLGLGGDATHKSIAVTRQL